MKDYSRASKILKDAATNFHSFFVTHVNVSLISTRLKANMIKILFILSDV